MTTMLTYRGPGRQPVYVDPDMGLGRQYGYRNPAALYPACDGHRPARPPQRRAATCHPGQAVHGHGLCKPCYDRDRREQRRQRRERD